MRRLLTVSCLLLLAAAVAAAFAPAPGARGQDAPPCTIDQLAGAAFWQGATGSLAGGIVLENIGNTTCTVQGTPVIALADAAEGDLGVALSPEDKPRDVPPAVLLQPGDEAWAQIIWRNWCGDPPAGGVVVLLTLNDGAAAILGGDGLPLSGTPRCDAPGAGSLVVVGHLAPYPPQ